MLGELLTLEVIAVLEFNSDRKRMSIIVRMPNGRWALFLESQLNLVAPPAGESWTAVNCSVCHTAGRRRLSGPSAAARWPSLLHQPAEDLRLTPGCHLS